MARLARYFVLAVVSASFLALMIIHKRKWLTDADMASLKESEFYLMANQVIEGTRAGLRGTCVHEAAVVPEELPSSPSSADDSKDASVARRGSTKKLCPVAVFEDKVSMSSSNQRGTSAFARCDGASEDGDR